MGTRRFRTAFLLVILSGCATAVSDHQMPPDGFTVPEGLSADAVPIPDGQGLQSLPPRPMLLIDGEFAALKELRPRRPVLRRFISAWRSLLRRGDLKRRYEAELAAKLEPKIAD
jgi:hypothetical protein